MDARIKNKISPPVAPAAKKYNDLKTSSANDKVSTTNKVNFKDVLINSNRQVKQKRQAEANGDLSGAKSYEDFLEKLNNTSQKQNLPKNTLGKDDFLNLFITQLQNQDPLNPKDGTEMASQLAQFNSLEQMININGALGKLDEKASLGHDIQFVNYIGKEVAINNGKIRFKNGQVSNSSFKINHPVSRTILEVRDSLGKVIATKDLGPKEQGEHTIKWDGIDKKGQKVPDGIYTFAIVGKGKGGSEVEIPVYSRVKITGVDLKDPDSTFYTNLGKISYAEISEIGEDGFYGRNKEIKPYKDVAPNITLKKIQDSKEEPKADDPIAQNLNSKEKNIIEPPKSVKKVLADSKPSKANPNPFLPDINKPFSVIHPKQ